MRSQTYTHPTASLVRILGLGNESVGVMNETGGDGTRRNGGMIKRGFRVRWLEWLKRGLKVRGQVRKAVPVWVK